MVEEQKTELYQDQLDGLLDYVVGEIKTGKITEAKINGIKYKITQSFLLIAKLCGKIEILEKELKHERENSIKNHIPNIATFADVTKQGIGKTTYPKEYRKPEGTTIIITPKENEDTRKTEKRLKEILNPRKEKINIKNIKTTKNAIIIETRAIGDSEKILTNEELRSTMNVEKPRKKRPKIIIYDIPSNMTVQELQTAAGEQNLEDHLTIEEVEQEFKPLFKTGPRNKDTVHHVAEVSPRVRKILLGRGRLYLPFISVAVKDYIVVPKCLKCQDLGHVAKHCRNEETTCAHCGQKGHEKKECGKINDAPVCVPCKNRGKKCDKTGKNYRECETQKLLRNREIEKTEYE